MPKYLVNGVWLDAEIQSPVAEASAPITVLFFNGAFCNRHQWDEVTPTLTAAGISCITMDCRGIGESGAAPKEKAGSEQFNFDQYAADADGLLQELQVQGKVVVAGMAWGARPALVFASRFPARVEALCLLDASVGQSISKEWLLAQSTGTKLARAKMQRIGIVEPSPPKNLQEHSNRKLTAMAMHATSKAPYDNAESFLGSITKLSCNTLLATGEFDPNLNVDPGGSEAIVGHLRPICAAHGKVVELKVLEVTGHASALHRPHLVARTLVSYVQDTVLPAKGSGLPGNGAHRGHSSRL